MPCEHCPHCQKIEEEQRLAAEKLLAEQQIKQEILEPNDAPPIPVTIDLSNVYEHLKPVALQIFHTWVENKIHVIDGIAGGGKTFLLNVLWKLFKDHRKVQFLSYSEIGSATRTTISKYLDQYDTKTEIFLIDNVNQIEESMLMRLDEKLKYTFNSSKAFGGICVIMAVDFGMCTPYCKNQGDSSSRNWISGLGEQVTRHYLSHSGNGRDVFVEELRTLPKLILEDRHVVTHENLLIQFVYGELNGEEPYFGMDSKNGILLAPRKCHVDALNRMCMEKLSGETFEFEAKFDGNIIRGDLDLPTIFLKKYSIIALATPYNGLPVGTRLMFMDADKKTLFCRIIDGEKAGSNIEIGRIPRHLSANPSESQQWVKHFPVELAFAMSIHRTQGRRFTKVGISNLGECFAHGMVYSAMSRTDSFFGTKILVKNDMDKVVHTKFDEELMKY